MAVYDKINEALAQGYTADQVLAEMEAQGSKVSPVFNQRVSEAKAQGHDPYTILKEVATQSGGDIALRFQNEQERNTATTKSRLVDRKAKYQEFIDETAKRVKTGETGIPAALLQVVGKGADTTFGGIYDAASAIPGVRYLGDKAEEAIAGGIEKAAKTEKGKKFLAGATELVEENPETARNLQAGISVASVIPGVKAITKGVETAAKGAEIAVKATKAGTGFLKKAAVAGTDAAGEKLAKSDLGKKIVDKDLQMTKEYNDRILNLDANSRRLEKSYTTKGEKPAGQILAERGIKIGSEAEPTSGRILANTDDAIDTIADELRVKGKIKSALLKEEAATLNINELENGVISSIKSNAKLDPTIKKDAIEGFKKWMAAKKEAFADNPNLELDMADQIRKWADDNIDFKSARIKNRTISDADELFSKATRDYIDKYITENVTDTALKAMNKDMQELIRVKDLLQKRNGQLIAKGGVVSGFLRKSIGAAAGASLGGGSVGSVFGAIVGARSADEIANIMESAPRFVVNQVAKRVAKNQPEKQDIFEQALQILEQKKYQKSKQLRLPAPGQTAPRKMFVSPRGNVSTNRGATLAEDANQRSFLTNQRKGTPTQMKALPAPKSGRVNSDFVVSPEGVTAPASDTVGLKKATFLKKQEIADKRGSMRAAITKSLNESYKKAPAAKKEIDSFAEEVAKELGGKVKTAAIKSRSRSTEKVLDEYRGDHTKLTDIVRNTIVLDGNDKLAEAFTKLSTHGEKGKHVLPGDDPFGYTGVNVKVKAKNGMIGEVQANTPEMLFAKESPETVKAIIGKKKYSELVARYGDVGGKGHKLYEEARVLDPRSAEFEKLAEESRNYYSTFYGN